MPETSRLLYVPIGHTSHESSSGVVKNDEFVRRLYRGINAFVNGLPIDLSGYIIFNDSSTPEEVNGLNTRQGQARFSEHLRINGLTEDRLPHDHLTLRLLARRARLVCVEDPALLREQGALIRVGGANNWTQQMRDRFEELNRLRDRKITVEVEKAMRKQVKAKGILFLGAAHQVDNKLAARGVPYGVPQDIFQYLTPSEIAAQPLFNRFLR